MSRSFAALCATCVVLSVWCAPNLAAAKKPRVPTPPASPSPADGATGISTSPQLTWSARFATRYDVYFGTALPLPLVSSGQGSAMYAPSGPLANGTTYLWQVVAINGAGATSGPVWSFTTAVAVPTPQPPGVPQSPSPSDGASDIGSAVTLTWTAANATSYDVSVGLANPPGIVAAGLTSASYALANLQPGSTYYWQVVAVNADGSTPGPVWSFSTAASQTSTVWHVPAGGDFQAALDNALPGDTIELDPGATFTGNFVLPAKGPTATSFITIRSAAPDSALPPAGVRMSPGYAVQLPKLRSPNSAPALRTAAYAHHYRLELLEFLANAQGAGDILQLGDGSSVQNTLTMVPHHLVVDRVYIHGDAAIGQKRGIALNSADTTIENSYVAEIKSSSQDSQAICGWNGPGPYTVANNYLEAAGENVMFGGSDPSILDLVPSDITFTRNHLAKQLAWKTQSWVVKNLFELKNAQRVVAEGNVMEYNWLGGQPGYSVLFTPRNQGGTAPWTVVQHVVFTNNVVRHVSSAVNILGTDNLAASQVTNDIAIRNNLFVDVSGATYGGVGRLLLVTGGVNITFDHNTVFNDGSSTIYAYGAASQGFTFTNNIIPDNKYGIMGDSSSPGNATIAKYFPNGLFLDNVITAAPASSFPTGNYYPATMNDVGFVDYAGGNYRLAAASAYHNGGSDGTDVGANIDAVNAAAGTGY
jgi:hypothetical protein